jgi:hypothetical protein
MQRRSLILSAFALLTTAAPALGQSDVWQRRWFWGAQGGVLAYESPVVTGRKFAPTFGGHWLITGKNSALYVSYDQILFLDSAQSAIVDASAIATGGIRLVDFSKARRIQASVFAVPMSGNLQIMIGGGFAINQITDATPQGPFATLQEAVNATNSVAEVDTKAFVVLAGGVQYRYGKWAVFANYNFMPSSKDYLITSSQHTLMAGIRYALAGAHEEISTDR